MAAGGAVSGIAASAAGGAAAGPLPFNVITGFLGAGKTTLLNRLLARADMGGTLVIVNEFGEAGLDHALVEAATDEVIELASGCLCCTLRGDLVETLVDVLNRREAGELRPFSRIVVETSGLADPVPILHSVMGHGWLLQRLRLDGVVAVVDALCGADTLAGHAEARRQAALADRLVITKAELLPEQEREEALQRLRCNLRALNRAAPILLAGRDEMTPQRLFHGGLTGADGRPDVQAWLRTEAHMGAERDHAHENHPHEGAEHSAEISSFAIVSPSALSPQGLEVFLDLLRANFGAALLRVKGIIRMADDEARPVVIHGVQHIFHPPARLPGWPAPWRETRIVFITRGDVRAEVERLFAAIGDPLSGHGAAAADDTLSLLPGGDG